VRCYRLCARLEAEGRESTSSQEIGERLGCSPSQVRKDFSKLGRLGTRGSGYRVQELQTVLGKIIGKGRQWDVVLVGAGNLGTALLKHGDFERQGFRFVAVFDADPDKVDRKIGGLVVQDVSCIPETLRTSDAEIGVITVPATGARWIARLLAENGVRAILNFARTSLWLGGDVTVSNVDLTTELEKLAYYLSAAKTEPVRDNAGSSLATV
jgi:redox-sensing transcriptional repressor